MDIRSLEQQAIEYAKRGDFGADAKRVNEELARAAPENEGALTRLARCNIELGLLDDANVALEAVLQLNPQNTIARSLLQEAIRRQVRLASDELPAAKGTKRARARTTTKSPKDLPTRGAFGRAQFAALGQLPPPSALESLGPGIEALLMALNERPFAAKVVEARNRAARSGSRLFRRNSIYAGEPGHIYAFQHGGRWEPQFNIGFSAAPQAALSAIRAGIGFNLSQGDTASDDGPERVAVYYERFQQLVSSAWKQLLTDWMAANGGFIQYGDRPPAVDLMPADAVAWLIENRKAAEQGWVFVGRWLFPDRGEHAEIMENPALLVKWMEQSFADLLPLWMSVYRER